MVKTSTPDRSWEAESILVFVERRRWHRRRRQTVVNQRRRKRLAAPLWIFALTRRLKLGHSIIETFSSIGLLSDACSTIEWRRCDANVTPVWASVSLLSHNRVSSVTLILHYRNSSVTFVTLCAVLRVETVGVWRRRRPLYFYSFREEAAPPRMNYIKSLEEFYSVIGWTKNVSNEKENKFFFLQDPKKSLLSKQLLFRFINLVWIKGFLGKEKKGAVTSVRVA